MHTWTFVAVQCCTEILQWLHWFCTVMVLRYCIALLHDDIAILYDGIAILYDGIAPIPVEWLTVGGLPSKKSVPQ